jgi:hypothetical protein
LDKIKLDIKKDMMGWYGLDLSGSSHGPVEGSCEHGNKPLGSVKYYETLEYLHNWRLLIKGSGPWSQFPAKFFMTFRHEAFIGAVMPCREIRYT